MCQCFVFRDSSSVGRSLSRYGLFPVLSDSRSWRLTAWALGGSELKIASNRGPKIEVRQPRTTSGNLIAGLRHCADWF